jgi:phage gp46-like protein
MPKNAKSYLYLKYDNNVDSPTFGMCDLNFDAGNALESSVLMSLFSWRRVSPPEVEDGTKRYGWWADVFYDSPLGSKLWLLRRRKVLPNIIPLAKQYVKESLQWLVDTGVAVSIDVDAWLEVKNPEHLYIKVVINKANDGPFILRFEGLWQSLTKDI